MKISWKNQSLNKLRELLPWFFKQSKIFHNVTGRPGGSVVGYSAFSPTKTFGGQCAGPCLGCEQQRQCCTVSSVLPWFWADSGMNLIKQGKIVTGRQCDSVDRVLALYARGSRFKTWVLGSRPGRAMCFFLPDIFGIQIIVTGEENVHGLNGSQTQDRSHIVRALWHRATRCPEKWHLAGKPELLLIARNVLKIRFNLFLNFMYVLRNSTNIYIKRARISSEVVFNYVKI